MTYHIGDLAEKYETGNRGPGYISNGATWGDPGGDSYGPYQLETNKGTMQDYLKGTDKFVEKLKPYVVNSVYFKMTWRKLAAEDPEGFQQSQFDFLIKKHGGYNDAIAYAELLGWGVGHFALQSAIFSTSNQSGGWKKGIFDKAEIHKSDSIMTQINKLYDARADYFRRLRIGSKIKENIIEQRTVQERKDCLKLI